MGKIHNIYVNKDKAEGEALDISHGLPFAKPMQIYAGDYKDAADAAVIVVTAGAGQKPGETRLDLVKKNISIFKAIMPEIKNSGFEGILLIVANPVDILTHVAQKLTGFPESKVFGSGTVLDTARFKYLMGEHLRVDSRNIDAHIKKLRKRFMSNPDFDILTVRGLGYKAVHKTR